MVKFEILTEEVSEGAENSLPSESEPEIELGLVPSTSDKSIAIGSIASSVRKGAFSHSAGMSLNLIAKLSMVSVLR